MKIELNISSILYGAMVYWNKIEDAARYYIKLYIDEQELETVEIGRNKYYHTFQGLANYYRKSYYVQVQAENRIGEIVALSEKKAFNIDGTLEVVDNSNSICL